jgi:histidine triad (HIT) family protein
MTAPAAPADCLFCRIATGEIPADLVHETATAVAFRDLNPQAPTHVLVIPRAHHAHAAELADAAPEIAAELLGVAATVADAEGLTDYRLVFNTGAGAGQSVFHAHLHLLGGRPMTWPPG